MKLGSISNNSRDGCPVLVDRYLRYMVPVNNVIDNWQLGIENWSAVSPKLEKIYEKLDKGLAEGAIRATEASSVLHFLEHISGWMVLLT